MVQLSKVQKDTNWTGMCVLPWNSRSCSCSGIYRSSRLQMFFEICVLKNFTIFTGKHLCWSCFFKKIFFGVTFFNFIKKRPRGSCFPVNTAQFLRTAIFRTPLVTASEFLTKLAENKCEENHFSVDFFSEIS